MCESHPAVRHAAISLSAQQLQFEEIGIGHSKNGESLLALGPINNSITHLREYLSRHASSRSHIEIVLAICIILAVQTLFQENVDDAHRHILSSQKMYKEWEAVDY
jgi:hypothetical protein